MTKRLTISCISTSQILQLEVPSEISVTDLKALISSELPSASTSSQHLYHNGRLLSEPGKSLREYDVSDDDMIVLHSRPSGPPASASGQSQRRTAAASSSRGPPQGARQGQFADSEMIRLRVLGDPSLMEELRGSQPELAGAVNDPEAFRNIFEAMERQRAEAELAKQREIQMLNQDPFNIEAQQKIEELIRQEAVMENLQSALEHHPEAFGRVTMLYIPVEVNGVKVKAFVDSGAQATIMSPSCAESCGIMRLVDQRFAGIARGVGTAKILGKVHSAQIKIGPLFLACSFTVMEGKSVDLLLGLDMLKRHQASIDLKKGCLIIQDEEVGFLGESEIPKDDEMEAEPTVEPAGATVGGRVPPIMETPGASGLGGQEAEEKVKQLVGLGFSRGQAQAALAATNWDVDMAASLLFQ
ncbi:DNA damage-inducible protein 1 [Rhizina undulata]